MESRAGRQGFGRGLRDREGGRVSGDAAAAASGIRTKPITPPHHYWSKDVGKQKGELGAGGGWMDGGQRTEMGRESRAEKQAEMVTVLQMNRATSLVPTQANARQAAASLLTDCWLD